MSTGPGQAPWALGLCSSSGGWSRSGPRYSGFGSRSNSVYGTLDLDNDAEQDDGPDDIDQLRRIGELHKEGLLTDEEFSLLKAGLVQGRR